MTEFETDRLRLRRLVLDDAPFVLDLVNEPSWLRYIGDRGVHDLEGARQYISGGPQRLYEQYGFGLFLVERRDDGKPLGLCGLIKRDTLPDVDIGFAFRPEHWGQGYAREAAAATLRYARERHGLARVVAITSLDNTASGRVLESIGMRFEGTLRLEAGSDEVLHYGTTEVFRMDATNARQVFEGLWTSGKLSAADIERMPGLGVGLVVNLALPAGEYALAGEAEAVTRLGIPYVHIPVPWEKPELSHLQQFFGVMDAFAGTKAWVHCALNYRVSAFVYLYRRLRRGEPEAVARYPLRTVWTPNPTWQAFIDQALTQMPAQGAADGTTR
jgi:[ribosomal protein S5]-alanine N-acetyltransferase